MLFIVLNLFDNEGIINGKDILVKQQQDIFWLRKELLGLSQTLDSVVDNLFILANANDAMLKQQKKLMERTTTKSIQNDINNDED